VDAVVMNEVRVLSLVLAAGPEPDLPTCLIDAVDATDDVGAARDLVLDLSLLDVDQVKMPPAVAFRGVDDLPRLLQPVDEVETDVLGVRGPDEGLGLLVEEVPRLGGVRIDLDDAEALVPTVGFRIGERVAVGLPAEARRAEVDPLHL